MASKRLAKSTIDWAHFQKIVPPSQATNLNSFMSRSYQYVSKVQSLPDGLPKIDFSAYKAQLSNKALVEKFEKAVGLSIHLILIQVDLETQNFLIKVCKSSSTISS